MIQMPKGQLFPALRVKCIGGSFPSVNHTHALSLVTYLDELSTLK